MNRIKFNRFQFTNTTEQLDRLFGDQDKFKLYVETKNGSVMRANLQYDPRRKYNYFFEVEVVDRIFKILPHEIVAICAEA